MNISSLFLLAILVTGGLLALYSKKSELNDDRANDL